MKNIFSGMAASMLFVAMTSFAQPAGQTAKSEAPSGTPNDAQIAAIVVAANTVDIDAGKVAKSKSKNKEVKEFAQTMITDHTGVNKSVAALATKLKLKPEQSADSKSLKDDGATALKKLKGLKANEFDKEYIDNEVAYHQKVLDSLDKTLIPNAKNPDLKDLLTKVRPTIDDHLQHAKKIQGAMK